MSWQLVDGPSRRPRISCAILDNLRASATNGASPSLMAKVIDPDALLRRIDVAIANAENAQATRHLSVRFQPNRSTSPTLQGPGRPASSTHERIRSRDQQQPTPLERHIKFPAVSNDRSPDGWLLRENNNKEQPGMKIAMAQNLRPQVSTLRTPEEQDISDGILSTEFQGAVTTAEFASHNRNRQPLTLLPEDKVSEVQSNEKYDIRTADEAYRAACSALSEGCPEVALSLLHIASSKCPPHKFSALEKVRRLMATTLQVLERQNATSNPQVVDRGACFGGVCHHFWIH